MLDEVVSGEDMAPPPPDAPALAIKVQPDDAIFCPPPRKDEKASTRNASPPFDRFLQYAARTAVVVGVFGLAWATGAYYARGLLPFDSKKSSRATQSQQSLEGDEMVSSLRQLADEVRTLKTENQKNSVQAARAATINNLTDRIDKLEAEFRSKLSQMSEQLASVERETSTSHTGLESRGQSFRKHAEYHDAFDPSQNPTAPGAPRPLGAW